MKHTPDEIIEIGNDIDVAIKFKNLIVKIAAYIYVEVAHETTTSAWCVDMNEIEDAFGLEPGFIDEEVAEEIEGALYHEFGNMVAEVEYVLERESDCEHEVERYFDVTLYHNYIPGIIQDDASIEYEL